MMMLQSVGGLHRHPLVCDIPPHLSNARRRPKQTGPDVVMWRNVHKTTAHRLQFSLLPQSQVCSFCLISLLVLSVLYIAVDHRDFLYLLLYFPSVLCLACLPSVTICVFHYAFVCICFSLSWMPSSVTICISLCFLWISFVICETLLAVSSQPFQSTGGNCCKI